MILALSTNFIALPADEIDEGIKDVLGAVGNFASADRSYVFQFDKNGRVVSNTHEWCAHGISSLISRVKGLTEEDIPWLFERLRGLGVIHAPDTGLLPSKARAEKTKILGEDVQSLIAVPMVYGDSLIGFLGLDSILRIKAWDEEITSLLKIVGEIFANALARKKAFEAMQAGEERYRSIVENAMEGIFQAAPSGRLLNINPAMAKMYGYYTVEEMMEKVTSIGAQLYVDSMKQDEFRCLMERDGRIEGFRAEQRRKDGSTFWVSVNGRAVRAENGKMLYYEGTYEDITAQKFMEEMLHKERETFKEILEKTPYGVVLGDSGGLYLYVNPEYTNITGYTLDDAVSYADWLDKAYPEPAEREKAVLFLSEDGPHATREKVFSVACKNGSRKEISFTKTFLDDGRTIIFLSDITEKKKAEEALRESEEKFRTLFEDSNDAIYIASVDGRFVDCNRSFLNLFGHIKEEVLSMKARDTFRNTEDRHAVIRSLREFGTVRDFEVKLKKKDGIEMDCLLTVSEKKARDGSVTGYQGIVRDVTAFKKAEETIRHMAYHDSLTGLPNRTLFGDRLSVAMAKVQRKGDKLAVAVLDMDQFKRVNDLLGHKAGDFVLKAAANRLLSVLRKSDTVARMGGDEFMLILNEINGVEDVQAVVEKIVHAFRKSFVVDSNHFFVTVSIGGALYPDDGESAESLIRKADVAMYRAKRGGKNQYSRYTPELDALDVK